MGPEDREEVRLEPEAGPDVRSAPARVDTVDRRAFLKLMGSALAMGALSGCRKPAEKIVPYLEQPIEMTEMIPGVASWYATTCHGCSTGCGALAKVVDGRPIKFEGNPDHAMSRGGLCAGGQAAPLGLYDPGRQKRPSVAGQAATWDQVDQEIGQHLSRARDGNGNVVVLTGTITGPATRAVIAGFLDTFPRGRHVIYDAVSVDAIKEAHRLACGRPLIPSYRFDRADVIVSFGADFLGTWLSPVEFAKQYAVGRSPDARPPRMSRHFQFESRVSLTGSNADYRYTLAPSEQPVYLGALAGRTARGLDDANPSESPDWATVLRALGEAARPVLPIEAEGILAEVARALVSAPGRSLVISDSNDVSVQVAVLLLNACLGNVGRTVDLTRPSQQRMGQDVDMAELVEEMQRGEIDAILVQGCNPVYTYPQAAEFEAGLRNVPCSVSFACTPDETTAVAKWHCPAHHPMEAWADAEPHEGRFSLFQPTIRPLYETRAFGDSLLRWSGLDTSFYEYLKRHWKASIFPRQSEFDVFQDFWDAMLQRGFLEVPPRPSRLLVQLAAAAVAANGLATALSSSGERLEVEVFEPVAVRDGAAAGNAWLQELPDPISKITWGNCAAVSGSLAEEKDIGEGQLVDIQVGGRTVRLPAHLQPGQHPRTVSVALGYGRTHAGTVGSGVGVNAYPLVAVRGGRCQGNGVIDGLAPIDERITFASTQTHSSMEGRPIVQETVYATYRRSSAEPGSHHEPDVSLWQEHEYREYRWGMVIDLTKCIGCSACVVACDIENNVPVVGRDEVRRQREMHWIRIDRYFTGDPDAPRVVYQPMLCQHCANASCESVCPVLATVHDDQGLSVQVYNRCVGTRYCENNCPYKVRRFNFFSNISDDATQNLALNPDVTVRSRGVMEKCSFCIQRLQGARIAARSEGHQVIDGEVQTACQQSCPADAIAFGNLADPMHRVSHLAVSPRAYRVLSELNRQPSVHYLRKVRNTDEGESE